MGASMKMKLLGLVACMALLGTSQAGATTYTVNDGTASLGVTGTITTDGNIGVLSASDITDWNLLLNVSGSSFDLTGPLSGGNSAVYVFGTTDFTATASKLFFNFGDNTSFQYLGFDDSAGPYLIEFGNATTSCNGIPSSICLLIGSSGGNISEQGVVQIASTTPLPAALPLFATGLGALGLLGWRRNRKAGALAAA
jgi:hypothetical protein